MGGAGTGGSAKQARDRRFQAVLPLRGKIVNVERRDDAALYKDNEISNLIVALGLGMKGEDSPSLRYGKVRRMRPCSFVLNRSLNFKGEKKGGATCLLFIGILLFKLVGLEFLCQHAVVDPPKGP